MQARRTGTALLAALAPATALAVDPAGWFPFGPAKVLVLVALLPAGAVLVWRGGAARLGRRLSLPLALLLASLAGAALVGLDPLYAWTGTPERFFGWLTWALCALALFAGRSLEPERDGPALAVGVTVAGLGVALVALAEALGIRLGPIGVGSSRLTGPYGSSAYLGAAAALFGPIVGGLALDRAVDRRLRVAAGIATAGLAVALAGSGARAAWVGVVVGLTLLGWKNRSGPADRGSRSRVLGIGAGAVAIGVVVLVATPVGARLGALADADAPGGRGRVDEWRVAAKVLAEHPLTGVGPEGYRIAFSEGVDDSYEQAHGRDPLPDRAHSAPLDVALSGGLVALAAWLALLVGVGRQLLPALGRARPALQGVVVALVAYFCGQLLLFPLAELEPVAWLLAGAALAGMGRAAPGEDAGSGMNQPTKVPTAVLLVLGMAGVLASAVAVLGVVADRRAERAVEALAIGDGLGGARAARSAAELRPDVIRYRLLQARAQLAAGEGTVAALDTLAAAAEVSPGDPVVRLERVRTLVDRAAATAVPAHALEARRAARQLVAGDRSRAEAWRLLGRAEALAAAPVAAAAALERAADLAPRDPRPLTDLAALERAQGDDAAARRAVRRALQRDPGDPRAQGLAAQLGVSGP